MLTAMLRTSIITAFARLSILSVGPLTSVASARRVIITVEECLGGNWYRSRQRAETLPQPKESGPTPPPIKEGVPAPAQAEKRSGRPGPAPQRLKQHTVIPLVEVRAPANAGDPSICDPQGTYGAAAVTIARRAAPTRGIASPSSPTRRASVLAASSLAQHEPTGQEPVGGGSLRPSRLD